MNKFGYIAGGAVLLVGLVIAIWFLSLLYIREKREIKREQDRKDAEAARAEQYNDEVQKYLINKEE